MKRVLITGGKGQDGTLLTQLLKQQDIEVFSFGRPVTNVALGLDSCASLESPLEFNVDLSNFEDCLNSIATINPDTIFHLAAVHGPSHIMGSATWAENRESTYKTHVTITRNLIEAVVATNAKAQIIVAGSSRMYTPLDSTLVINESTATNPLDYYGKTKAEAWNILITERERTGLSLKMVILFNHESKLRKEGFLFRDLAKQIAKFELGKQNFIEVRDEKIQGDWHSALDTVEGLELLANQDYATDLVLASGKLISVSDIINDYFEVYLPKYRPVIVSKNPRSHSEKSLSVVGDIALAETLGWKPTRTLSSVLREMVMIEIQ